MSKLQEVVDKYGLTYKQYPSYYDTNLHLFSISIKDESELTTHNPLLSLVESQDIYFNLNGSGKKWPSDNMFDTVEKWCIMLGLDIKES